MAEDESDQESEKLVEELEAVAEEELRGLGVGQLGSREYCRRFCEVVEEYTARWQVPLPQLQVLQTALCCFTSASVSFPAECEHVQRVLSRLALSLFELLLFFGKDEFYEAPLKDILGSIQECHDLLIRYDNTDLRLVACVIKDGGPWENPVLQAILKGKSEPQEIVDKYLRSENQLFFEFRVRYLIACERISEAVALITTCLSHPEISKNLYYHQAYFTSLHMTRLTDRLLPEHVLRIDCSDGVQIICNIEKEGKTSLALQLSEAFLITQLQNGKMYCVWDLVFIWSKLQIKVNPSKQAFVDQCYHMLRVAANVKAIFPFMKAIREEIGEGAVQLSVELCGCALQLDLQDDPETKCLIYKTIAYLLPTDLEICRICALSVFFLDRSVESYRIIERLYGYSDEDYNEFTSCVENRVRFELLPILKRGLLFDPEFWSFSMIQTNCAALLGDGAAMVLSGPNASDNVAAVEQQSLPSDVPVMPLHNGELKHKESSSRLRLSSTPRKNHTVLPPARTDTYTPRHQCTLCNREFLGGHILRHAQTHHKKGSFKCVMCVRKFRNKVAMLRHLKHHLKKIQRRRARNSLDVSSEALLIYSDKDEINSSETTSSKSGNSNQDLLDIERTTPAENHTVDRNGGSLNHSTATQTSFSTDISNSDDVAASGEMQDLDDAGGELSRCVKLNGAIFCKDDPVVHRQDNYPCPAQGCQRIFQKVRALNKHARKAHPSDVKVQEHIMAWNKGKCRYCQRKFVNCRHFIDHLSVHRYPTAYVCQQLNCNEKFKFSAQLAEHRRIHGTFKTRCGFMDCSEVFDQISTLHEHEARHYEQSPLASSGTPLPNVESPKPCLVPQEDSSSRLDHQQDTALPPIKRIQPSKTEEALDLTVPIWKSRKDIAEPKTYKQAEKKVNGEVHLPEPVLQTSCNIVRSDPIPEATRAAASEEQSLNGHTAEEPSVAVETSAPVDGGMETAPTLDTAQGTPPAEAATENAQTLPKPNVIAPTAYGAVTARPFRRPLPPSYLSEQFISMPKRRTNGQEHSSENHAESEAPTEKLKCWKCLTNYCSSEALEQHLAQKKCQFYFGFDSDDESAW